MHKYNTLSIPFHFIFVSIIYFICYKAGIFKILPNDKNLLQWDALHHLSIKETGYEFIAYRGTNLAFFPLFPYSWKALSFSAIGISSFNELIFLLSYYMLLKKEQLPISYNLFLLAIPSFIFFALPYSEAFFFVATTLIVIGYRNNKRIWVYIGFFVASLVKSASIIFIPAIILTELLSNSDPKSRNRNILYTIISTLAGMCIAAYIQAEQTGQWFYFIEIQQYWGRHWIIPGFPLTTGAARRILGIDSIALVLGFIAMYHCVKWFIAYLKKSVQKLPPAVVFSALYLSASAFLDLCFTYNINGSANLWSLNRHFFCSPFSIVFLIWLHKDFVPSKIEKIGLVFLVLSAIGFAGLYKYPLMAFYYLAFFMVLILFKYYPRLNKYLIAGYLMNLVFQLLFFKNFISGQWIS